MLALCNDFLLHCTRNTKKFSFCFDPTFSIMLPNKSEVLLYVLLLFIVFDYVTAVYKTTLYFKQPVYVFVVL